MKEFKSFMTSIVCLAFCLLCFGCAKNGSNLNASQSSSQTDSSQTIVSTKSQLLGVLFVNIFDDDFENNDNDTFVLNAISIDENNQIKSSNFLIKTITFNNPQSANTLTLNANTTTVHRIKTLTQNKFNLEICAEIFGETKSVSAYLVTKATEKLCVSKIGKVSTATDSLSSLNCETNGKFSNSNIFDIRLKFSFDISSESEYSPEL